MLFFFSVPTSMSQSVWSNSKMLSSSNICLVGCSAEHLSSFQPHHVSSDVSDVSGTLHKDNDYMLGESAPHSSGEAGSTLICSHDRELNPARDGTTTRHPSPALRSCDHHDWNLNNGHQAKRARVENIIKGMTSSPAMRCTEVMTNQYEEKGCMQENERIQELPLHQQLEGQYRQLGQLRTKLNHVDDGTETTYSITEDKYLTCNDSPDTSPSRDRIKLMADVLKYELSRAVSRSVDYIFKSIPLLQTSPNHDGSVETDLSLQSPPSLSCFGNPEVQDPDVQTEALSLVMQKPRLETPDKLRAHPHPKPPVPFPVDSTLQEDVPPEKNQNAVRQQSLRYQTKLDTHWSSVKVRSKVNSRSVRSPQTHTVSVDPVLLENLCLPRVKIEPDSLVKNSLYMLNEGLTTNHLKKAKLMFFYTRYPSSLVLKMCFHDVQFTRCITSQLIKWFSNFREFYYIQMEKFARHALVEGVADVRGLTVGRESELFRALNMHYNKANDFQVPDRFLEVAEITLREFYIAISLGKDRDPSWKKAIYKVICKLDSDVPADFKSHHSG
uniref:Prospero domain-containing protein n=1 Tax=Anabas testudineus TaxID=64144 RepID=A0A3Q1HN32_ANATE